MMGNIEHRTSNTEHRTARRGAAFDVRCSRFGVRCFLILLIRLYRLTLSPAKTFLFGPGAGCRFTPSCSVYALEALKTHGALAGGWLAAKRICRCHPWGDCGHDPVPAKNLEQDVTDRPEGNPAALPSFASVSD